ncbi:MAG: FtsQ-type POTRA domain-containing protein [Actinomycetaceae bacterium]|nr:FtsQ-type POTRA domain-containing protein [Actinomycetaceae bacterium]
MRRPQVPRSSGAKRTSEATSAGSARRDTHLPEEAVGTSEKEFASATKPAPLAERSPQRKRRPSSVVVRVENAPEPKPLPATPDALKAEKSGGVASKLRGYFSAERAAQAFASKTKAGFELSARRKELRSAKLRAYGWYGVSLLVGAVVVGWAIWGIFFSSLFSLDRNLIIVTNGADKVNTAQIQETLDPWVGTPLPRLKLAELTDAVETIPLVKTASISREWPNGLSVDLQLRVPTFAVSGGSVWEVYDAEGVKIASEAKVPAGTFVAEVSSQEPAVKAKSLQLMNQVKGQLDSEVLAQVVSFRSDGNLVELVLKSGAVVKWGDTSEGALKLKVLRVLMTQVPAKVYDVSVPAKPVTA